MVEPNAQPVSGIDAFVNFDPSALSVTAIAAGAGSPLGLELNNSFDNTAGHADFSAGTLPPPASAAFTLATITFNAKAASTGAAISFNTTTPRQTNAVLDGNSVLAGTFGATVIVNGPATKVKADIDVDPNTLNLKSNGKWLTVDIELTKGYAASDIALSTVRLNGTVPAVADGKYGFVHEQEHHKGDNGKHAGSELTVKFSLDAVKAVLSPGDKVTITVTGKVDSADFEGNTTIRVISKDAGKDKHGDD